MAEETKSKMRDKACRMAQWRILLSALKTLIGGHVVASALTHEKMTGVGHSTRLCVYNNRGDQQRRTHARLLAEESRICRVLGMHFKSKVIRVGGWVTF